MNFQHRLSINIGTFSSVEDRSVSKSVPVDQEYINVVALVSRYFVFSLLFSFKKYISCASSHLLTRCIYQMYFLSSYFPIQKGKREHMMHYNIYTIISTLQPARHATVHYRGIPMFILLCLSLSLPLSNLTVTSQTLLLPTQSTMYNLSLYTKLRFISRNSKLLNPKSNISGTRRLWKYQKALKLKLTKENLY